MGYRGKSAFRRVVILAAAVLHLGYGNLAAQEMSPGELKKAAYKAAADGNNQEAISLMYQYLDMVVDSQADRVIAIAQDIRFRLARILIEEEDLESAAVVLEEYTGTKLCKFPRAAMRMLATCYYESDRFEETVETILRAIEYNENPVVVVEAVGGDEGVQKLDKGPKDEAYTPEELTLLHMTLAEAYFNLAKWSEAVDAFTYVIQNTEDEQRKGYAIMQVINSLIEIPDFDRINQWIPELYRTDARYDIRVNMALMNVAAALYDEGEYDSALPLYRMILPRDEVIAYQQERLRSMRMTAGMIPVADGAVDPIELMLFGGEEEKKEEEGSEEGEEAETEEEKPKELRELEALIAALEDLPAYENNIAYRIGQIYEQVYRYWEAVEYFDAVYSREQDSDLGQRSVADAVTILLESLKEIDEATARGFAHLSQYTNGVSPRQVGYTFTGYFQRNQQWDKVKELLPYLDNMTRTNDADIIKYDAELYFMQGVADLMTFNYEGSEKGFKRILDEFPGSHQEGNALYWHAMSKLFLQKYDEAGPLFDEYIEKNPEGDWVDEAYFQGGICMFGLEDYVAASNRFTYVIDTFPESGVYPNACSMRGDLRGAAGELEIAIEDYKKATSSSERLKTVKQATYATFQMATLYEAWAEVEEDDIAQGLYSDLITIVDGYLTTWAEEADVARATFWLGKIMIRQERIDEAVEKYLDAIVRFGDDLLQDGVDMMIAEMVKVSKIWLGVEQQGQLMEDIQAAIDAAADKPVLQLRLRVLLAKLDDTEVELGKRLINELPDLEMASPPALAAICDASFVMEDYSRAEELLNIFISRYEESDYVRAAYKLRAFGQFVEEDYDGALKTIEDVQGLYGHDRDIVWAMLMKARIHLAKGEFDEARAANSYVWGIPQWRGEPVAEATYQSGQVEEKAGELRKAIGYYQRTYAQYKGHAGGHWAAQAYLASARCLGELGLESERLETYRAMLYDKFVNDLEEADVARKELIPSEVSAIEAFLEAGGSTNVIVKVDTGDMVDATVQNMMQAQAREAEGGLQEDEPAETDVEVPEENEPESMDAAGMESE